MSRCVALCAILCLYLGLQDGHLALMEGNNTKYIFPYRAELYTDLDFRLLQDGISLPNEEMLSVVLEDYFS